MRIQPPPGQWASRLQALFADPSKLPALGAVTKDGHYLHWNDLRYRPTPEGLTAEDVWALTKLARSSGRIHTPFRQKNGQTFSYITPPPLLRNLTKLDQTLPLTKALRADETEEHRRSLQVLNLIDEAFSSSALEGAITTHHEARDMIANQRPPANAYQRMVMNNYNTMLFIKDHLEEPLTPAVLCQIHRLITDGTLDDPDKAGVFRSESDHVTIADERSNEAVHIPPPAYELPSRMALFCNIANAGTPDQGDLFIHPVILAITLHFMIGYDHPFIDGNGRTARALFYRAMLRAGYDAMGYLSLSKPLLRTPRPYYAAFQHVETDEGDLTYFLVQQVQVVQTAIDELTQTLARRTAALQEIQGLLGTDQLRRALNHRQLGLLQHAARHPGFTYSLQSHATLNAVSYQTSRKDLLALEKLGLLLGSKDGKERVFIAPANLRQRLSQLR